MAWNMKQCTKCKRILSESDFHKCKKRKDGLKSRCKDCRNKENREYFKQPEVRQHKLEYGREYSEKNKEKLLLYWKEYRQKNKEKEKQRHRKWRRKNPEKNRKSQKKYKEKNKLKIRQYDKEYNRKSEVKERNKKHGENYRKTIRGKNNKKKYKAKRRRNLKWVPLFDNPFSNDVVVDFHHINNILVIPLPRTIHNYLPVRPIDLHRSLANDWIKKLYCLDVDEFLSESKCLLTLF